MPPTPGKGTAMSDPNVTDPRPPGRRGYKAIEFAADNPLTPWAAKLRRAAHGRYACRYMTVLIALDAARQLLYDARDRYSPNVKHDEWREHGDAGKAIDRAMSAVRAASAWVVENEARHTVTGKVQDFWPARNRFDKAYYEEGKP